MKKIYALITACLLTTSSFSQVEIEPFAPTVPGTYLGDFNNVTSGLPVPDNSAWTEEGNTGTNDWLSDNGATIPFGGNPNYAYASILITEQLTLVSPEMDFGLNTTNPTLNFSYRIDDGTAAGGAGLAGIGQLEVLYKESAGGSWVSIGTYSTANNTWSPISLSLAGASNFSTFYIGFRASTLTPGAVFTEGLVLIDDIVVTGEPNCSNTTNTLTVTECGSYTVPSGHETYTASQMNIKDTIPNMAGCDSILTINLTINPLPNIDAGPSSMDVCVGEMINLTATGGIVYTWFPNLTMPFPAPDTSLTMIVMGADANSCSNSDTITLNPVLIDNSVTANDPVLTANQGSAAYVWLNCVDSTPVLGANNQAFTPTSNGDYAVEITLIGCKDTSTCNTIATVSIIENEILGLNIYPNPTNGLINIDFGNLNDAELKFFSTDGRLIETIHQNGHQTKQIELNHPKGIYIIEIKSGNKLDRVKLVKD